MLTFALPAATAMLGLALLLTLYRLVIGPTPVDRILALDTIAFELAGLLLVQGIAFGSLLWFEAAVLMAAFGFVGTVALARYAERGRIVD